MPRRRDPETYARIGGAVVCSTILLTAAFVGVLSLSSGSIGTVTDRLPWYVLGAALVFVGAIVGLEEQAVDGNIILATAASASVVTLVLLGLAAEGVRYAFLYPDQVFVSQLVVYVLAAALITTGLAYWILRHWREFTGPRARV